MEGVCKYDHTDTLGQILPQCVFSTGPWRIWCRLLMWKKQEKAVYGTVMSDSVPFGYCCHPCHTVRETDADGPTKTQ